MVRYMFLVTAFAFVSSSYTMQQPDQNQNLTPAQRTVAGLLRGTQRNQNNNQLINRNLGVQHPLPQRPRNLQAPRPLRTARNLFGGHTLLDIEDLEELVKRIINLDEPEGN